MDDKTTLPPADGLPQVLSEALQKSLAVGVYGRAADGTIFRSNPTLASVLGKKAAEIDGRTERSLGLACLPAQPEAVDLAAGGGSAALSHVWVQVRRRSIGDRRFPGLELGLAKGPKGEAAKLVFFWNCAGFEGEVPTGGRDHELALAILEHVGEGAILADRQGRILNLNQGAADLTGYAMSEVAGRPALGILQLIDATSRRPCAEPLVELLSARLDSAHLPAAMLIGRSGVPHQVSILAHALRNGFGQQTGALIVIRSAPGRGDAERARLARIDSLGILSGRIAHDFNNILGAVLGNISMAKLLGQFPEEVIGRLDQALKACHRGRELTQHILTFAKSVAPAKRTVVLRDLIRRTVETTVEGQGTTAEFALPADLWFVQVDPTQMEQVIRHLAQNAIESVPQDGRIFVDAWNAPAGSVSELLNPTRDYVGFKITDRGVGIPPELLNRIFDPFFTTKRDASGLGLTIAFSVVKQHEGLVKVDSQIGTGTSVTVYLPAAFPAAGAAPSGEGFPWSKTRILVMDDEPLILDLAHSILEHLGCKVMVTKDGTEALAAFQKAAEAGTPFDAVLLDLIVPGGMGGEETAQRLLKLDSKARIVLSSGYVTDPAMLEPQRFGFRAAIMKPYIAEDITRVLRNVLEG